MKSVIEYYNKGQDDIEIKRIYYDEEIEQWMVVIYYEYDGEVKTHCISRAIGFYEWLFNPKYKVFEVFGLDNCVSIVDFIPDNSTTEFKQPEGILKILAEAIK